MNMMFEQELLGQLLLNLGLKLNHLKRRMMSSMMMMSLEMFELMMLS